MNCQSGRSSGASKREGGRKTPAENGSNLRNVAAAVLSNDGMIPPEPTPPGSPMSTTSTSRDEHTIARAALPRNPSIDSALSSVSSSADHSHKSSHDSNKANFLKIRDLISTAGSAEDLIAHLLKEKQHAASQNAQLWTLVDKQRSLLIGLNQDLERAIQDRGRYKKRLKELQAQLPAPQPLDLPTSEQSRTTVAEAPLGPQPPARHTNTPPNQASFTTPNNKSLSNLHSSPLDPAIIPSPLHLLQNQKKVQGANIAETGQMGGIQQMPESVPDHVENSIPTPAREPQPPHASNHSAAQASFLTSPSPTQTRSVEQDEGLMARSMDARLSPVPVAGSTAMLERPQKTSQPTRKPPPAPLNLKQGKPNNPLPPDFPPVGHPDTIRERQNVQETSLPSRGRRKTREEDDRDRELAAQLEQEARSRSSKSSKSNKPGKKKPRQESSVGATDKAAPAVQSSILPTSSLQVAVAPPSEDAGAGGPSAPSSIAALLSPDMSRAAPIVERTLAAPPMSPGLPLSPRPADRPLGSPMPRLPREGAGIPLSPPMSARGMAPGLPLSPRPPPRPAAPPTHTSFAVSTPPASQEAFPQPASPRNHETARPVLTTNPVGENAKSNGSPCSPSGGVQIDRGLIDPAYPNLLLPPNALTSICIKVSSSRLRPKRHSYTVQNSTDEDPVFTLSILSRSDGRELWRVEKAIMALPQVDQQMKNVSKFSSKLPERKLFSGHSPAIIDARRTALNHYFGELLDSAIDERSALVICHFLSSDVIEARDDETSLLTPSQRNKPALALGSDGRPVKEGYLTKRGKNFGGWKVRYFVLSGPELKYFESPGGTHLGTIKLQNAQIGKQTQTPSPSRTDEDVENQYRHAFLVLEPKRKDSSSLVRHVLCAESDQERDEWVLVLMQNVEVQSDDEQSNKQGLRRPEENMTHLNGSEAKVTPVSESYSAAAQDGQTIARAGANELKVIGYEQVTAGVAPTIVAPQLNRRQDATPSPASTSSVTTISHEVGSAPDPHAASQPSKSISAPKNGSVIQDAGSWGNKPPPQTSVKDKKRSMWGFRQRGGSDSVPSIQPALNLGAYNLPLGQQGSVRAVFGLPLAEAVELCPPRGVNVDQPAVVYRCIEYLRAKDAASEEGIFRLSGSNLVIKALRERFNTEGDVNFLAEEQYYDVHAVASLFKSYLRELPSTVLTKELHLDFLHVLELDERSKKIAAFNMLVHRLPRVNLALLTALSQYLIEIVNNADRNKMTVRNMGIVFSPTLNIPAPVFGMFLTDFEAIFGNESTALTAAQDNTRTVELSVPNRLAAGDIRSPRHQMFSDLPTPAYNQTTFSEGPPTPTQFPTQPTSTGPNPPMNPPPNPPPHPNVAHNTGFIPIQPSYETRTYISDPQAPAQPQQRYSMAPPHAQRAEYGSMNMMMAPANAATLKAKRRESSMLFMGMGHRKSSLPKMRDDSGACPTRCPVSCRPDVS